MGENASDRSGLLMQLANLERHPESVPINMLVKVKGTPLDSVEDLDPFEFVRTIAVARIIHQVQMKGLEESATSIDKGHELKKVKPRVRRAKRSSPE